MSQDPPTGTIVWKDLTVENADVIRDFYAEVVGWKHSPCDMGGYDDYNMIPPKGDDAVAGICHARGGNSNLPSQWLIYVSVEDIDSSIRRSIELGGHLVDGPRKMGPNRFCVVKDPAAAGVEQTESILSRRIAALGGELHIGRRHPRVVLEPFGPLVHIPHPPHRNSRASGQESLITIPEACYAFLCFRGGMYNS